MELSDFHGQLLRIVYRLIYSMPAKTSDGRDELNLAEFPLCALANRLRPDQKTLRFEDRVWDDRRGVTINRQLTITGSDAYGLPELSNSGSLPGKPGGSPIHLAE